MQNYRPVPAEYRARSFSITIVTIYWNGKGGGEFSWTSSIALSIKAGQGNGFFFFTL